ncbi:MFS transporter [Nocardia thraciensis]
MNITTDTTRNARAQRFRGGRADRLPAGVYLLGFSLFAMGSAEFLLAGVLPEVATDFDVTLSSAGMLITAFALGVVFGGPPFAVLSLRWPRRTALVATQGVFAAAVAVGLLGNYQVLLVSRAVAGLAYAGFFAVASVTAISLVTRTATPARPESWSAASAWP